MGTLHEVIITCSHGHHRLPSIHPLNSLASLFTQANVDTPLGAVDMTINAILMTDVLMSFRTSYHGVRGKGVAALSEATTQRRMCTL